jgi:hypothetical protein
MLRKDCKIGDIFYHPEYSIKNYYVVIGETNCFEINDGIRIRYTEPQAEVKLVDLNEALVLCGIKEVPEWITKYVDIFEYEYI